jgi:dethiobiotin synthetase
MPAKKIIFITGTGTGVGKTLLAASLLHHLRHAGVHALAMKPFCSGGTADVRLLQSLQPGELSDEQANPFYFPQPIAPLVAAKKSGRPIQLPDVTKRIRNVAAKCDCLIVEGSGGLLVPLARGLTVADLIAALDCRVLVASLNQLGTINHTLLTVGALSSNGISKRDIIVALMNRPRPDLSARTNAQVLGDLLKPVLVVGIPFLGARASRPASVRSNRRKLGNLTDFLSGKLSSKRY